MESNQQNIFQQLAQALRIFRLAGKNSGILRDLLNRIGWDLSRLNDLPFGDDELNISQKLKRNFKEFIYNFNKLEELTENPPEDYKDFVAALILVHDTFQSLKGLHEELSGHPEELEQLGNDLQTWLITAFLEHVHPVLFYTSSLLNIISFPEKRTVTDPNDDSIIFRKPVKLPTLKFSHFKRLLADPVKFLKESYLHLLEGKEFKTLDDMVEMADRLFGTLHALSYYLKLRTNYRLSNFRDNRSESEIFADKMFAIYLPPDSDGNQMDITLALSPKELGGLGLVILFFGKPPVEPLIIGDWEITLTVPENLEGISVGTEKVVVLPETEQVASVSIGIKRSPAESVEQRFIIGDEDRTHFDVPFPSITGNVTVKPEESLKYHYDVGVEVGEGKAVIEELLTLEWANLEYSYDSSTKESTISWTELKIDTPLITDLFDINITLKLVFNEGELQESSSIVFNAPNFGELALKELGWNWDKFSVGITEDGITIQAAEANFNFGDSWKVGWESLEITLPADSDPSFVIKRLTVKNESISWIDFELDFSSTEKKIKLYKPKIEKDLSLDQFHFESHCLAMQWQQDDITQWIQQGCQQASPNFSLPEKQNNDSSDASPRIVALRILRNDKENKIQEIRLDWEGEDSRTFSLPGIDVTLPKKIRYSLVWGGQGRSLNDVSLSITVGQEALSESGFKAMSTFAWERGDDNNRDRELQNDPSKNNNEEEESNEESNEEEKEVPHLFSCTLTPKQSLTFILIDFKKGKTNFPTVFRENNGAIPNIFSSQVSCSPVQIDSRGLQQNNWKIDFQFNLGQAPDSLSVKWT
ncbi:hypothetical protein [Candidatus Electrothrix sp.]|uniref:hypothetical protein n=1 Tax=Candidatus Electrothrix sp. TaxID=2170559 RepID=UPI004056348D